MKQRIWIAFGLIALALLGGCAGGGHGRDINDASNSLVFGYVDMSDAPPKVNGASIMQVAPPTDKPYWGTDVRNGLFYTYYLGSDKYKDVKTGFFEQGKCDIVRVKSPTEAELLRRILDEDKEIKGSAWEAKIRERLARLK